MAETRYEMYMRWSNVMAESAAHMLSKHGDVDRFEKFSRKADEFARMARRRVRPTPESLPDGQ